MYTTAFYFLYQFKLILRGVLEFSNKHFIKNSTYQKLLNRYSVKNFIVIAHQRIVAVLNTYNKKLMSNKLQLCFFKSLVLILVSRFADNTTNFY